MAIIYKWNLTNHAQISIALGWLGTMQSRIGTIAIAIVI